MQRRHRGHLRPADEPPAAAAEQEAQPAPVAEPAFDRMSPLIESAQRGDARALEELLGLLAQPLLRAVCALLGRAHSDVDDVVQDVLIDVASALPSFRGESTLLHFAIRIAARKATVKRRRASSVRGFLARFETQEDKLREPVPSPGEVALAESRRRVLCELLSDLPEEQAETMVLRALLGHSIEEIASITRAPINTVRSRLRLAKDALRKRLAADPSALELLEGA
jgi:RNA polymerase sigma factor (sigma-70 family)